MLFANDPTLAQSRQSILARTTPDGRVVEVQSLTFGRVQLTISASLEADGWDHAWMYEDRAAACVEFFCFDLAAWNSTTHAGEPDGWRAARTAHGETRYQPSAGTLAWMPPLA